MDLSSLSSPPPSPPAPSLKQEEFPPDSPNLKQDPHPGPGQSNFTLLPRIAMPETSTPDDPLSAPQNNSHFKKPAINREDVSKDNESTKVPTHLPRHARRQPATRPTCTHTTMVKLYGLHACSLCGRQASAGFVYACEQDKSPALSPGPSPSMSNNSRFRKRLQKSSPHSPNELESVGLSRSIIHQANAGEYTAEQIEVLKSQKLHVARVIESVHTANASPKAKNKPSAKSLSNSLPFLGPETAASHQLATIATRISDYSQRLRAQTEEREAATAPSRADKTLAVAEKRSSIPGPVEKTTKRRSSAPDETAAASSPTTTPKGPGTLVCDFKVCHTCRPGSRDRSFMSFEQALNNEVALPSKWHAPTMPVHSRHIVCTLGTKPSKAAPQPSEALSLEHENKIADASFSNMAQDVAFAGHGLGIVNDFSQFIDLEPAIRATMQERLLRMIANNCRTDLTWPILHQSNLEHALDAVEEGYHQGHSDSQLLWQILLEDVMSKLSIDDPPKGDPQDQSHTAGHDSGPVASMTATDDKSTEDGAETCETEDGESGVALTEEAVTMHTPDVITSV